MAEQEQANIASAFDILKQAMHAYHAYAWTWHCNIAMSAYDAGCGHWIANQAAARFMHMAFEIDVTPFPEYQDIKEKYV